MHRLEWLNLLLLTLDFYFKIWLQALFVTGTFENGPQARVVVLCSWAQHFTLTQAFTLKGKGVIPNVKETQ